MLVRVANGINTVRLSYMRGGTGHSLIGCGQWIPAERIEDADTAARMGLPQDLEFATKGQLATTILARAHAETIVFDFVCGDEVYGNSPDRRRYCEQYQQAYVLRVSSNFVLTLADGSGAMGKQIVRTHLRQNKRWQILSAGAGDKGRRYSPGRGWVPARPSTGCWCANTWRPASVPSPVLRPPGAGR